MISLDWTLILQFINFMVLLYLLNRILFQPLRAVMDKRRETIDGSHARARDLQADIDDKMSRYQQQLAEAKKQANDERGQIRKLASEEESKMIAAAQSNAGARMDQIKEQVGQESARASQTLKKESTALAQQIATKILGRSLT
ncbi:ATP synthase F0 subunit B [Pelovirga terrestris]|uniref:ATP synthase subunit b n=1 Tax=Pelovirga terrestris TaxID=2771352 RepID=A0A8J6UHV8_9BACT|nr:ATP synthase F0 subunit B [Pelovirga terrestris]